MFTILKEKFKKVLKNNVFIITIILLSLGFLCNRPTIVNDKPVIYTEYRDTSTLKPSIVIPNFSDTTKKVEPKQSTWNSLLGRKKYYHKVKSGENLYRLSLKYNTTVQRLMELNRLPNTNINKGEWIYVGTQEERMVIPTSKDSLYHYEEKYGNDTLGAIVKTDALGPIQTQFITIKAQSIEVEKNHLFVGAEFSNDPLQPINLGLGLDHKSGWTVVGKTTLIGADRYYQLGIYKDIKFK